MEPNLRFYYCFNFVQVMRKRDFRLSDDVEGSTYESDIWAMIGTVLLW